MAITFITGVSGSGKSYYSVYTIYKMFTNKEKKGVKSFLKKPVYSPGDLNIKYDYVYTNINQFNFDFHPLLVPLDFDDLLRKLSKLRRLKVDKDYTDDELIIEAKKLNLFNVLIVVDEAQDYFPKKADEVTLWWLTYHRHLNQDIHILTQHLDQLDKSYLKNGVYFYRMPPPSMAIFSNRFTVSYFSCVGMTQKCREKSFTIPFDKNVGKLYVSGDKAVRKSILKKYLLFIFPFLIFFVYGSWWYFNHIREEISPVQDKTKKSNTIKQVSKKQASHNVNNGFDLLDKHLVKFSCVNVICVYNGFPVSLDFVLYLLRNSDPSYKHIQMYDYNLIDYSLLVDKDTFKFISENFISSDDVKKKDKKDKYETPKIGLFGGK